ncbi:MAG TPA: YidC/Oxa1 family membrane protein insertase [Candidatus Paceibacterota bacterium]
MLSSIFHVLIYDPIYNGLVFFVDIVPGHDIGIAVIIVTIVVRVILFPLSRRAIKTQMAMKKLAPEIEELKKKYKKEPQEQGRAIFALYRERGVHPFSGFALILIQIPVLLGLYWVFAHGGFPQIDSETLYSFVPAPADIKMYFLGMLDMAAPHNAILAFLVALSQLFYSRLSMGPRDATSPVEATLSSDMARSFDLQARYVFPLLFGVISYFVVAAAPLYWLTSNLFMIGQEFATGRRFNPKQE